MLRRPVPVRKKLLACFQSNGMKASMHQLIKAACIDVAEGKSGRKAVITQFKFLKIMDYYPRCIAESDLHTEEMWELLDEHQYEMLLEIEAKEKERQKKRLTKSKFVSLHNQYNTANKRVDTCLERCGTRSEQLTNNASKLNRLMLEKANIEYAIAIEKLRIVKGKIAEALEIHVDQIEEIDDLDEYYENKWNKERGDAYEVTGQTDPSN